MITEQTQRAITRANSELKRCLEGGDIEGAIDAHARLIDALATLSGELVQLGLGSFTVEFHLKPLE